MSVTVEELCRGFPGHTFPFMLKRFGFWLLVFLQSEEFATYIKYCRDLRFTTEPDYGFAFFFKHSVLYLGKISIVVSLCILGIFAVSLSDYITGRNLLMTECMTGCCWWEFLQLSSWNDLTYYFLKPFHYSHMPRFLSLLTSSWFGKSTFKNRAGS